MKFLSTILSVMLMLIPFNLNAIERDIVEHEGESGYWFSKKVGEMILEDLEELRIKNTEVSLLNEKLELKDETIALLRTDLKITEEIEKRYKTMYEYQLDISNEYLDRYGKCMEENDKWYRHPTFWGTIGMVIGAILTVGIGYALYGAQ